MSLYAWLMIGSIVGPLLLSFDKKVAFYKHWPALFAGILINGLFFISWDVWFAHEGIWSFNSEHVWSVRWLGLPIEEWSFFVVVPYCSVFIYCCCKVYFKDDWIKRWSGKLSLVIMLMLAIVVCVYTNHRYTFYNGLFALVLLGLHQWVWKKNYMGYFWMAYLIHLIPFLIINGVLTAMPVVIYNAHEIIGPLIYTIPVEDTIYALTCLLIPVTVMEWLSSKKLPLKHFPDAGFKI